MAAGKVLIIVSDADIFAIKREDGSLVQEETGLFLQELTKPLAQLLDAGFEVTVRIHYRIELYIVSKEFCFAQFASPKGRGPNIDPISQSTFAAYMGNFVAKKRDNELIEKMKDGNNLDSPRPFASINDDELASYAGVFIPGGHAPLTDLGDDSELGRILLHFHNGQKPTGESI